MRGKSTRRRHGSGGAGPIACPFLLFEVLPVYAMAGRSGSRAHAAMDDCGSSSGLPAVVCIRSSRSRFDSGCVRRVGGSVRTNGERHGYAKQWASANGGVWMAGLVTLFDTNNPSARNDRVELGQRVHARQLVLPRSAAPPDGVPRGGRSRPGVGLLRRTHTPALQQGGFRRHDQRQFVEHELLRFFSSDTQAAQNRGNDLFG